MLNSILKHLVDAGIDARPSERQRKKGELPRLVLSEGNRKWTFVVEERRRAPYSGELPGLRERRKKVVKIGVPLLHCPYVSTELGSALIEEGWSWADDQGNFDVKTKGLRLRQRATMSPPPPQRNNLPRGKGSIAVLRALMVEHADTIDRQRLREVAGISPGRVSQVLGALEEHDLVRREGRRAWIPDAKALLDAFLNEYPGPGGMEASAYSLDPPLRVALTAADWAQKQEARLLFSADTGPDLVAPWRRPSTLVVYCEELPDLDAMKMVKAHGREDANVLWRVPEDSTVFHHPLTVQVEDSNLSLVDAPQMLWDLHNLGGDDRVEAAQELQSWFLRRR